MSQSNADLLLRSLEALERRAGVLQDEPVSNVVIWVDFRQAARSASRSDKTIPCSAQYAEISSIKSDI